MKTVEHDRQFFGFFYTQTFFNRSRVWSVGYTGGMEGEHTPGYLFAAHKITVDIVKQFVAVYIAVVIGDRDRKRMVVEHPGNKGANNKITPLKSQVHRWRLMYAAGYGLKIVDGKGERIAAAVPANGIKGMMAIVNAVENTLFFRFDQKSPFSFTVLNSPGVRISRSQ